MNSIFPREEEDHSGGTLAGQFHFPIFLLLVAKTDYSQLGALNELVPVDGFLCWFDEIIPLEIWIFLIKTKLKNEQTVS